MEGVFGAALEIVGAMFEAAIEVGAEVAVEAIVEAREPRVHHVIRSRKKPRLRVKRPRCRRVER